MPHPMSPHSPRPARRRRRPLLPLLLLLALLLGGCAALPSLPFFGPLHGSGCVDEDVTPDYGADAPSLSQGQEDAMLAYLDAWYAALSRLEEADFSALFSDPLQARFNESALALQVGLRTMTPGVDYSLIGYSYTLTVLEAGQEEDGTVSVLAQEASTQNFAQFPGVDARRGSNYHFFSLSPSGEGWLLAAHIPFDILASQLLDTVSFEELAQAYIDAAPSYLAQLQAAHARREADRGRALTLPEADHPYDRQAALDYADAYAMSRNPEWADYSDYGGNCQNFASQCLYAGGIPMDIQGSAVWKWYGSTPSQTAEAQGRSASWTGVGSFRSYALENTGFGLVSQVDAPYYAGQPGDLIQMGDATVWAHTVVIRQLVRDGAGQTVDYLIHSNTNDMENYPASLYGYPELALIAIAGWND